MVKHRTTLRVLSEITTLTNISTDSVPFRKESVERSRFAFS